MIRFNFQPFPVLRTTRLTLRQLMLEDDRDVFAFRSDQSVGRYLSRPLEENLEGSRIFIENINEGIRRKEWCYWGLAFTNDRIVGTICLWNLSAEDRCAEVGYELHPDYQKKGLMQEALLAVLQYGFQTMQLERVEAYLQAGNAASVRLLERNQFQFVRNAGAEEKFEAEKDMVIQAYALDRKNWKP